jgi:predicted ATPase
MRVLQQRQEGSVFGQPLEHRALLVITFRSEFAAPWVGRAHVASLQLSRFGRRQAVAFVDGVTAGKALPAEVLNEIVARTDGVPLFMEELTKTHSSPASCARRMALMYL